MDKPYVVEETENYAVVFKPAKLHSESKNSESKHEEDVTTIYNWFFKYSGFNENIKLMHRLDFETNGLVLFAKNKESYNFFKELQDKGEFIKEYSAICVPAGEPVEFEGFPDKNFILKIDNGLNRCERNNVIQSYFRPYGPGRKLVRPVIEDGKKHKEIAKDNGGFYKTEIINMNDNIFTLQIKRGFRHQIRCHLCWAGYPILNDPLYPHGADLQLESLLALRSHALFFADPVSGGERECRIEGY